MLLGVQVSIAKDISEAPQRAALLGCSTMQMFSRNPSRWRRSFIGSSEAEEFKQQHRKFKIKPLFIHLPYTLNLASPDERLYRDSIEACIEDILEAHSLGADYVVTHMGSHKQTSLEQGIQRFTAALNMILERTQDTRLDILLENTAGSGSWLGAQFWQHRAIIQGLKYKKCIGICFDTAHAFLAGYDLISAEGLEAFLDEIQKEVGLERLKLIHLNDAKDALGSRRDRHADIGKGKIGLQALARIINHPKLKDLPFILETPRKTDEDDIRNLETVRSLRQN